MVLVNFSDLVLCSYIFLFQMKVKLIEALVILYISCLLTLNTYCSTCSVEAWHIILIHSLVLHSFKTRTTNFIWSYVFTAIANFNMKTRILISHDFHPSCLTSQLVLGLGRYYAKPPTLGSPSILMLLPTVELFFNYAFHFWQLERNHRGLKRMNDGT